jgi:hypothetical protein
MKKFFHCFLYFFIYCYAFSQQNGGTSARPNPAGLRADGKIYVVVAVVITILFGLILYLIRLDRKISRIEKQLPL